MMECYIIGSILQIADVKKAYLYAAAAKMEGLGLFIFPSMVWILGERW
ncbi:hypothetical protein RCG24_12825 [Neobacillus sp. OS1-32]|nr:hypothetical protein [Neobacillus sp. OS1-32]WML28907.1 hypothetical protein RCG24_12825 [Neobacillus sp. OS1-32]